MNIKFSIVIPVYNVEYYLAECLNSIINQTYQNVEVIIINDGSTDNSLVIINEYAAKDARIIVIDQENQGLSIARNVGLKKSTGDYVMFIDSDDYISLDTCQIAVEEIQKGNFPDIFIYGRFRFYNDERYVEDKIIMDSNTTIYIGIDYLKKSSLKNMFYASACNKIYKRGFINKRQLQFIKGIYHEDLYFTFCALMFAEKVELLPSVYYYYRWDRPNSITNIVSEKSKNILITVRKLESLLYNVDPEMLDEYFFRKLIYQSVSSAVCYRFLFFRPFSHTANKWVKDVLYDSVYYKYVRYFAYTSGVALKYKLPAWLSINAYPLFVLFIYSYFYIKRQLGK